MPQTAHSRAGALALCQSPDACLGSKTTLAASPINAETFGSGLQARQDFKQVKDIAGQAGRKFSNLAQNFIKDLQGGY